MFARRLAAVALVASSTFIATVVGCGGDDSCTTPRIDAATGGSGSGSGSGNGSGSGSGSGNATMGIGQPCTPPATGSGQGDCPAGYTCLNLMGASHPWCSKPCATGSGDQ